MPDLARLRELAVEMAVTQQRMDTLLAAYLHELGHGPAYYRIEPIGVRPRKSEPQAQQEKPS